MPRSMRRRSRNCSVVDRSYRRLRDSGPHPEQEPLGPGGRGSKPSKRTIRGTICGFRCSSHKRPEHVMKIVSPLACMILACTMPIAAHAQAAKPELQPVDFNRLDTNHDGKLSRQEARAEPELSMEFDTL